MPAPTSKSESSEALSLSSLHCTESSFTGEKRERQPSRRLSSRRRLGSLAKNEGSGWWNHGLAQMSTLGKLHAARAVAHILVSN